MDLQVLIKDRLAGWIQIFSEKEMRKSQNVNMFHIFKDKKSAASKNGTVHKWRRPTVILSQVL